VYLIDPDVRVLLR